MLCVRESMENERSVLRDLIFLEKERIHFRLENIFKADASDVCLKNTGLIAAVDFEKSRIALSYIVFIFI